MRQIDPYKRICFMCEQAELDPKEVCLLSKTLFTLYQDSKIAGNPWKSPISKEKEDKQKRRMRREFLDIARHQIKDSFEEQKAFVWDALACPWIDEKITMIMTKMEQFPLDGALYKKILEASYLSEYKTEVQLFNECNLRKTAFYKKREAALTLFGIMIWNYAESREQEDRDNGLVD